MHTIQANIELTVCLPHSSVEGWVYKAYTNHRKQLSKLRGCSSVLSAKVQGKHKDLFMLCYLFKLWSWNLSSNWKLISKDRSCLLPKRNPIRNPRCLELSGWFQPIWNTNWAQMKIMYMWLFPALYFQRSSDRQFNENIVALQFGRDEASPAYKVAITTGSYRWSQ